VVKRSWLVMASVAGVGVVASLGLVSDGSAYSNWVSVALTATGSSPSTFTSFATDSLVFSNRDSVAHTVAFTNPTCSFSVPAGYALGPGGQAISDGQQSPLGTPVAD
jgi:hypothetical protein